jgi:uroporphyrinogen decarboxylase
MNKRERVAAVIAGRHPDRPPVSFWYHFEPDQAAGEKAVEAHLRHLETYDLDFLKIMDDNRYPRFEVPGGVIASAEDLGRLSVLRGDEDTFGRQLELIGELARRLGGQVPMTTTIFNAWSTLRQMTVPDTGAHGPPTLPGETEIPVARQDAAMTQLLHESPAALARALQVVAESTANFARRCLDAGADGIYLSVRDDWVDSPENDIRNCDPLVQPGPVKVRTPTGQDLGTFSPVSSEDGPGTYDCLVSPGDLQILAAAAGGTFNLLHVCGRALDFRRFAGYPVHVINWADRSAGPSIAEAANWVRPALCAGVDNLQTMVTGSADDCAAEVADALHQAGPRPIMIAPGCTFDPHAVPAANLRAIRVAVER